MTFLKVKFDFEAAQKSLKEAIKVVGNDFFLGEFKDDFLDNARYLKARLTAELHQKIDLSDLLVRHNLSRDEGEKWIVNPIRETRMGANAKIDLEKNIIEINRLLNLSISLTRGLAVRTRAI